MAKTGRELSASDEEISLIHDLQAHQLEYESQNEALHRVQPKLDIVQGRYFDPYNRVPVGYCMLNKQGLILEADLVAASLLGVDLPSLVKENISSFILPEDLEVFSFFRKRLMSTGTPQDMELRMVRADGTSVRLRLDVHTYQEGASDDSKLLRVTITGINDKRQVEDTRRFLAQQSPGENFFKSLAQHLSTVLGMDFVCISALEDDGLHAKLAVYHHGEFEANLRYALKDSPWGEVVGKTICCFPAKACQVFPHDEILKNLRAESYIGVRLWNDSGQPIGLLAVIGRQPLTTQPLAEALLKLVAIRTASELERSTLLRSLIESEKRYAMTIAVVQVGLWEWQVQSGDGYCSPRYYEILGYDDGEFPADYASWRALLHPHDVDRVEEEFRQATKQGKALSVDFRMRKKSGEWLWVCEQGRAVEQDARGRGLRMIGTMSAVSERKMAEELLRQSEEKYRLQFFQNSSVMLMIDPEDGRIVDANAAAQAFYGYPREQLLGRRVMEMTTLAAAEIQARMASVTEEHGGRRFESCHRLADGSVREVEVSVSCVQVNGRSVLHSIVHDISLRKEAEKKLQKQFATYQDILATTPDGFWIVDFQGHILDVNESYCRASGYSREELLAMRPYDLDINESAADTADHMRSMIETGYARFETIHRRKDGSTWHVEASVGVSNKAGGQFIAFLRDTTARKKADAAISSSLQVKDVLLKEIHHRVKNNLQVIHSILSLQAKRVAEPATRLMFEESLNRVCSMALIHERLYQSKDLSRIEFKEYLQNLVDAIAVTYQCPNVTCAVEMAPLSLDLNVGIPCGLIANELVSNCLKHAFPEGRQGTITVGIHKNKQGDNVLTVEDNGIGCPSELGANTSALGLQIVNGLTSQIHGTLERSVDLGTQVRITFPGTSNYHGATNEHAAN